MKQFCFLLTVFFVLAPSQVHAQRFLVLEKMGTKKRHEFHSGDVIIFKLKEGLHFQSDEIVGFGTSELLFETGPIPIKDIERISLANRRGAWAGMGSTLVIAGIGYSVIDIFNKTISDGEVYLDGKVARSSAIIAAVGVTFILISKKKVRVKGNWRLRIVDI